MRIHTLNAMLEKGLAEMRVLYTSRARPGQK
jgi:hypothetical protein